MADVLMFVWWDGGGSLGWWFTADSGARGYSRWNVVGCYNCFNRKNDKQERVRETITMSKKNKKTPFEIKRKAVERVFNG
ncbi:hypothetical protein, partial [Companilactobacillus zhongbaensis]|uniref:hypothetical protein n=1 Tax=Companilactobacillus zhongbaensis TaxID=2486009 RepID=UPI001CDD4777